MERCTFAVRIDSSRSAIQVWAREALRDSESVSEILLRIADETSVDCFFGRWDGMGKAMPCACSMQKTCPEEVSDVGSATADDATVNC